MRLDAPRPGAFIIEDQRHLCARRFDARIEHGELLRNARDVMIGVIRRGVRQQQRFMHLLLRERRLPPAKITHRLGAGGESLEGPEPHGALGGRRIPRRPIHRPRLLLHHLPSAAPACAVEIVMKRLKVRIADAHVAQLEGVVVRGAFQKAERVAVPRGDVEIVRQRIVVEVDERAHEVVEDRRIRRVTSDDLRLAPVEGDDLIGREALEIHQMRRIGFGDGQVRQLDLVEASIFHRPEDIAPGFVQRFDRAIFGLAPSPKRLQSGRRIAEHSVVAAIFIVGLPRRYGGVAAEGARQMLDDAVTFLSVAFVAETIVSARTEFARPAVGVERRHLRHLVDEPFGRRRRWRPKHDLKSGAVQRLDRPAQPIEAIGALAGLQP